MKGDYQLPHTTQYDRMKIAVIYKTTATTKKLVKTC